MHHRLAGLLVLLLLTLLCHLPLHQHPAQCSRWHRAGKNIRCMPRARCKKCMRLHIAGARSLQIPQWPPPELRLGLVTVLGPGSCRACGPQVLACRRQVACTCAQTLVQHARRPSSWAASCTHKALPEQHGGSFTHSAQHPEGASPTASLQRTQVALDHAAEQQGLEALLGWAAGQVQTDGEVLERQGGQGWRCMERCRRSGALALRHLSSSLASTSFAAPRAPSNTRCPSCCACAPTRTASGSLCRCMYE